MPANKTISEELKNISPALAPLPKAKLSEVPNGYFEHLPEIILSKISDLDEDYSYQLPAGRKETQSVPDGYFSNLNANILAKVKEAETISSSSSLGDEEIYPVLDSLKKRNVFTVPQGYFESFSAEVLQKLPKENGQAKVVSFKMGMAWKYLAAAAITGLILISAFFMLNNKPSVLPEMQYAKEYKTSDQLNKGIASLSDDEIVQYLEDHGSIMDNDMLIQDTDTKELPSTSDYFMDDNALNKYLDHLDSN